MICTGVGGRFFVVSIRALMHLRIGLLSCVTEESLVAVITEAEFERLVWASLVLCPGEYVEVCLLWCSDLVVKNSDSDVLVRCWFVFGSWNCFLPKPIPKNTPAFSIVWRLSCLENALVFTASCNNIYIVNVIGARP